VSLRNSFGDAFISLPLLLMGFLFFLGTLTSNTGLLLLFMGHLVIVPALAYLGNETGTPFHTTDASGNYSFSPSKTPKVLFACLIFYLVHGSALSSVNGDSGYALLTLALYPIALQYIIPYFASPTKISLSHFDTFNLANLFGLESIKPSESINCSIVPGAKGEIYNRPSDWANHIVFFFGFLITNAVAVYNEPIPKVNTAGSENETRDRQARINARVANRKFLTASIVVVSVIVLLLILVFRYNKSQCEESIYMSFIPLLIAGFTGASWFTVIYKACGVRPTDILGIVQGMVPTEMVDNPIVCVGT
jgi:hypothetical protein